MVSMARLLVLSVQLKLLEVCQAEGLPGMRKSQSVFRRKMKFSLRLAPPTILSFHPEYI